MKILIVTGIYPPAFGGPAAYALGIEGAYRKAGHNVSVKTFTWIENVLPTGVRHVWFMLKSIYAFLRADKVIVLDTWSVALPIAWLSAIFRKPFLIRTGGDFLWESYVERTKKSVLLRNFYETEIPHFNFKERVIFKLTKYILRSTERLVFSTAWQRTIWERPYQLNRAQTAIVENFYGPVSINPIINKSLRKVFIASTRNLFWKNTQMLKDVFMNDTIISLGCTLDLTTQPRDAFLKKVRESYAIILVSLGDISPNMILDSIACGTPFIVTREIGIYDRIKDAALFVDPLDYNDIIQKVVWLSDAHNYKEQCDKIARFDFLHSWDEISKELIVCK